MQYLETGKKRYVVDTCALISYFKDVFGADSSISKKSLEIIDSAFRNEQILLIIPATVFIEIFNKWILDEESRERIKSEIYFRVKSQDNIEIQPLDKEVLEKFVEITDIESDFKFDNHDKQILAAAIALECPLISSDSRLIRYNERKKLIPIIYT